MKSRYQIAVVDLIPAKLVLQRGLENAEHLAVHVVLGRAEKEESADHPAEVGAEGWRV